MAQPKLIIIEGIMGSGKTSTARFVAEYLREQGLQADLFSEGELDHPADYEYVAALEEQEFAELAAEYPVLREIAVREGRFQLVFYAKTELPDELVKKLRGRDVYDGIGLEAHRELTAARWAKFAEDWQAGGRTAVFECCFLQNPSCKFLAMHNAGAEALEEHVLKLDASIAPLEPLVIYFHQADPEETIRRVSQDRSEDWLKFVSAYHTDQEYGKAHGLEGTGVAGFAEFLKMRRETELTIVGKLQAKTLVIDLSDYDHERGRAEVRAFLDEMV